MPIVEISEACSIPLHVLEQLFAGLRRAGVLQSQRGVKGGYSFRRPPAEVTILEIVEGVDGRLAPEREPRHHAVDRLWAEITVELGSRLSAVTVGELLERQERAASAPMFHI